MGAKLADGPTEIFLPRGPGFNRLFRNEMPCKADAVDPVRYNFNMRLVHDGRWIGYAFFLTRAAKLFGRASPDAGLWILYYVNAVYGGKDLAEVKLPYCGIGDVATYAKTHKGGPLLPGVIEEGAPEYSSFVSSARRIYGESGGNFVLELLGFLSWHIGRRH